MSDFAAELVTDADKSPEAVAKEVAPGINRHKQILLCPKIGATVLRLNRCLMPL
jgi:hypothetical protein